MKIAVYSIALNEEKFVERWAQSAREADEIVLLDTGSKDKTTTKARKAGVRVVKGVIDPWRFDDARNAALSHVSRDIDMCIALDLDEVLVPGWRVPLELAFARGVTRPRYTYTWSWQENGQPGLQYQGDKIHLRRGYRWRHPVHEVLTPYGVDEVQDTCTGLEIHHFPDSSKSRGQYLPLLEMSVREDPDDDRNAFYFARELMFYGQRDRAIDEFQRHLTLPRAIWEPERAQSMIYLGDLTGDLTWYEKAVELTPWRREPLVALAQAYLSADRFEEARITARRALEIQEKPLEYICDADAWSWKPHDILAVASFYLQDVPEALEHGKIAVMAAPATEAPRLTVNLRQYRERSEECQS